MADNRAAERQFLLQRLHEAVKECQIHFGGKTELATDTDGRVSVLCAAWENIFQHGLKHNSRAISAVKQLTEVTGFKRIGSSLIEDIKNLEPEPTFWNCVKELLSVHELQRYNILHNISTDAGRARAWLRATLNERTLERSLHRLTSASNQLVQHYETWAFLRDPEKSSFLPNMAAGLGSILFAIRIDRTELNSVKCSSGSVRTSSKPVNIRQLNDDDQCPVVSSSVGSPKVDVRKDHPRKKKPAKIVSFDTDDTGTSSSPSLSVVSPMGSSSFIMSPSAVLRSSESDLSKFYASHRCDSKSSLNGMKTDVHFNDDATNGHCDSLSTISLGTLPNGVGSEQIGPPESHSPATDLSNLHRTGDNSRHNLLDGDSKICDFNNDVATVCLDKTVDVELNSICDYSSDDVYFGHSSHDANKTADVRAADTESIGSATSNNSNSSNHLSSEIVPDNTTSSTLQPVGADGLPVALDTISLGDTASESYGSYESHEMPAYSELLHDASLAVAQVQQALNNRALWADSHKICDNNEPGVAQDTLSADELKQAIVAMMLNKDEIEEQNKRLLANLNSEKSLVAGLHSEIEELKHSHAAQIDKYAEKTRALTRENDLLKHQLKKYVSAVQMLRNQGATAEDFPGIHIEALQPTVPAARQNIDYSEEALAYEKKLVQVAEMHGELMEFNDLLHKQLLARELQLRRLTEELTLLRGPLSSTSERHSLEDELISLGWDSDSASLLCAERPMIHIWIPSVFLRGSQLEGYHVYQIYIRIRDEEWNVYHRYAEFYELHCKLKKKNPIFSTFEFPPKKAFGKKDPKIVEVRRKKLESYLRHVVVQLVHDFPTLSNNLCRHTLINTITFFSDVPATDKSKPRSHRNRRERVVNSASSPLVVSAEQSEQHYMGL